ncbi:uncharacterized protein LOC119634783 isoform X1 [Glossina fuscipes]|uniref:Uncharacterized protein LOC119634783 isoform X1 n=1 Tax=Glossina fuscipes TaxID=7396 RepID=A0A8U0WJD3_9MUSC|nr:uncharacterized protein LOC119634783 isoform X1 [Glossina fuscipes]KAI9584421.1 hypothetical protein GQX74_006316 [Glossina fuscipes]
MRERGLSYMILLILISVWWVLADTTDNEDPDWTASNDNGNWVGHDAWSKKGMSDHSSCTNNNAKSSTSNSDDIACLLYFKKLIALVFARQQFTYNSLLKHYERGMHIRIGQSQLELLEKSKDCRDLDKIITQLFEKNYISSYCGRQFETNECSYFRKLIIKSFRDLGVILKNFEVRFLLIFLLIMICGWFVSRRWKVGYFCLIFAGIFLYGFLHTYLECNREIEVNNALEYMERQQKRMGANSWMTWVKSWFISQDYAYEERVENLKKSSQLNLSFCRPDHVLVRYINDLFMKYIEGLLDKSVLSLRTLLKVMPFPYNLLVAPMFLYVLVYLLKLTFKYILSPSVSKSLSGSNQTSNQIQQDRISGENLKILLSICSRHTKSDIKASKTVYAQTDAVSGVQEIRELIETVDEIEEENYANTSMSSTQNNAQIRSEHKSLNNIVAIPNEQIRSEDKSLNNIVAIPNDQQTENINQITADTEAHLEEENITENPVCNLAALDNNNKNENERRKKMPENVEATVTLKDEFD